MRGGRRLRGDFQGIGVYRSDVVFLRSEAAAPPFIVSMSPPDYPSAWLRPSIARFRFAGQNACSAISAATFHYRHEHRRRIRRTG